MKLSVDSKPTSFCPLCFFVSAILVTPSSSVSPWRTKTTVSDQCCIPSICHDAWSMKAFSKGLLSEWTNEWMHICVHERKWRESNLLSTSAVLQSQKKENEMLRVHGKFSNKERGFIFLASAWAQGAVAQRSSLVAVMRTIVGRVKKTIMEHRLCMRHCTRHFKTLFKLLNNNTR